MSRGIPYLHRSEALLVYSSDKHKKDRTMKIFKNKTSALQSFQKTVENRNDLSEGQKRECIIEANKQPTKTLTSLSSDQLLKEIVENLTMNFEAISRGEKLEDVTNESQRIQLNSTAARLTHTGRGL